MSLRLAPENSSVGDSDWVEDAGGARLALVAGTAAGGVAESRAAVRVRRFLAQPLTLAFVALTFAAVLSQSAGRVVLSPPLDVVDRFGIRLVDVAAGEWWRILSAAFVSSYGWPHALVNVIGALLVAGAVEREEGPRALAGVFAASAAAAFAAGVWGHGVQWLSAGGSGLVLGCAGFIVTSWSAASRLARTGAVLVLGTTFALPAALSLVGIEPRGSWPAHLGGCVAGAAVGLVSARHRWLTSASAVAVAVVSLLPLFVPLLPRPAEVIGCQKSSGSSAERAVRRWPRPSGPDTRVLFVTDRSDVAVRWISPKGEPGEKYFFTSDRRGYMPWYSYQGALYEVVDRNDRCLMRVRATRSTSDIHIP